MGILMQCLLEVKIIVYTHNLIHTSASYFYNLDVKTLN